MATLINMIWHVKFVWNKPKIILRMIKDLFYVRVLRRNRLRTIDWAVTYRCNSKCVMCSAKQLMSNKKNMGKAEMTVAEMVDVWKQAARLGAVHVNLTGGEPTVRNTNEIKAVIRAFSRHGAIVSMVTNSALMTREMLKEFRGSGLDTLQLSLESLDPIMHDKVRGTHGNHEKLMQVFRWAKELHLNICLSVVVTQKNFADVKKIIEFGRKENVFVLLNPISSSGEKAGDFTESITKMKYEYYELLKKGHVRADTIINFRGGSGCPAGVERIYITPYGEVLTCPHVQVSYGNVLKEPLAKIYKRISSFPYLKKYERDCRHVWNKEYINKIMKPTFNASELPISIYDHPIAREEEVTKYLKMSK